MSNVSIALIQSRIRENDKEIERINKCTTLSFNQKTTEAYVMYFMDGLLELNPKCQMALEFKQKMIDYLIHENEQLEKDIQLLLNSNS
jgi:predicted SprT family Zn-dependent metalloprotease